MNDVVVVVLLVVDMGLFGDDALDSTLEESRARHWMAREKTKMGKISVRIMMRFGSLGGGSTCVGVHSHEVILYRTFYLLVDKDRSC